MIFGSPPYLGLFFGSGSCINISFVNIYHQQVIVFGFQIGIMVGRHTGTQQSTYIMTSERLVIRKDIFPLPVRRFTLLVFYFRSSVFAGGIQFINRSNILNGVEHPFGSVGSLELQARQQVDIQIEVCAKVLRHRSLVMIHLNGSQRIGDFAHLDDIVRLTIGSNHTIRISNVVLG